MRVALASEGTRGDVYPMLDLGTALVAHGHEVVVCAPPDFREASEVRGLSFRAVGSPVQPFMSANAAALTGGGWQAFGAARRWIGDTLLRQFADLPEATRDVDRIVGSGIQLAGPSIAERHGVPYRYVVYCPALLPSTTYPPITLPVASLPAALNRLAWSLHTRVLGGLLGKALDRQRAGLGLDPVHDAYRHLMTDRPLVAADRLLAPVPADCRYDTMQIGCLHTAARAPLPTKLEAFLEQREPPLYFGFGSMTDPEPEATTRLLCEAIESSGRRALIQEGWGALGSGPLPDGVMRIGPCSHASLFPRCSVVVHHGGAGTTAAAARAGVPQLVVAHVADQFYWGRRVGELGLGPTALRRSKLTSARLRERLAEVLDNEIIADRAREIGERLGASHPLSGDPARFL